MGILGYLRVTNGYRSKQLKPKVNVRRRLRLPVDATMGFLCVPLRTCCPLKDVVVSKTPQASRAVLRRVLRAHGQSTISVDLPAFRSGFSFRGQIAK